MAVTVAGSYRVARHAPVKDPVFIQGIDLTGGSLRAQVRLVPEAGGAALIDLATVSTPGQQGFRFLSVDRSSAPYPISRFELCISKATLEGMPVARMPWEDSCFVWDLHFTPTGDIEQSSPTVNFIVAAGVTR